MTAPPVTRHHTVQTGVGEYPTPQDIPEGWEPHEYFPWVPLNAVSAQTSAHTSRTYVVWSCVLVRRVPA